MKIKTNRILGVVLATATVMGMAGTTPAYAASSISGNTETSYGVGCFWKEMEVVEKKICIEVSNWIVYKKI